MVDTNNPASANFPFLAAHDPLLLRLCVSAERYYYDDPNTTVIKLRQFGEAVVRHLAAVFNITATPDQTQADLLKVLQVRRYIDRNVIDLLHYLRREGNQAAHEFETTLGQALGILIVSVCVYLCYRYADRITKRMGPIGTGVVVRLSAFILLCIGVQICWNGLHTLIIATFPAAS